VDGNDEFRAKLNSWEQPVFGAARRSKGFVGWLRNYPRKSWSIAYAYEFKGEIKPGYPDFVVFRKESGHITVDLLEPHRGEDSLAKAHGLCHFAERHGDQFGKIEWIRIEGQQIRRLDLNNTATRKLVLAVNVDGALDALFNTIGTVEIVHQP
jgi:type III restriction enzyme